MSCAHNPGVIATGRFEHLIRCAAILHTYTHPRGWNKAEEFETIGPKIVILLDNASFHKKKEILEDIKKNLPNIIIEYLPAYSPDYNLIELVWHSAKEYIAHRNFENKEELEKVVNNLLNEGGLTINWSKKIKNKGELINAI